MEKFRLNVSIEKFIIRLLLITHLFITAKLPTDYLKIYVEIGTRFVMIMLIITLAFYDIFSCTLAGSVLIMNNIEYLSRIKNLKTTL